MLLGLCTSEVRRKAFAYQRQHRSVFQPSLRDQNAGMDSVSGTCNSHYNVGDTLHVLVSRARSVQSLACNSSCHRNVHSTQGSSWDQRERPYALCIQSESALELGVNALLYALTQ